MQSKSTRPVLVALVLATVACNLSPEPPSVTTSAPTTTTVPLTAEEAVVAFESCLTDHGFGVPDLPLDDAGRPDLSGLADSIDQSSEEWREALASCAAVIVANGALDLAAVPELAEAVRAQLLAFSACVRSQGVEGFPDPSPDFDGTTPPFPLDSIPSDDPELGPAAEACALTVGTEPPA
ncbi:MAG TPA: hypothetical protein VM848_11130 [Acidimicrobiia bacterium]|nr:hypothetical protein [Acidimicrobiia bacterium]